VRRTRIVAVSTLAVLNVFTLAAGVAVARMLPPRLAALKVATAAHGSITTAGTVLTPAGPAGQLPTATGLSAVLSQALGPAAAGGDPGIVVADAITGRVLYDVGGAALSTPASTTKLTTAVASLAVLGPQARFTTRVVRTRSGIILVGGGDPTLAVNSYPKGQYPQPATLAALARKTAAQLKADNQTHVQLGYDTSLYSGPGLAEGWTDSDVTSGNVTPIVSLEVDQGRLTAAGTPEDSDDPVNFRPRTMDPAGMAAQAFATLLQQDGITITSGPAGQTAPAGAETIASVSSPALQAMVEQMLQESNNVIAENLARHVAIATGQPATFQGGADAIMTELRKLGITSGIQLVDGSGLSPDDGIAPLTLTHVLELAASPSDPGLRPLITGLPVAGFTGTLSPGDSVFGGIGGDALGVLRAKTGNLETVAALAGLVMDRDGQLLVFAIMADRIPSAGFLQDAADEIDAAASGLAGCGCR
jgi:D-alanyl-D-alanine carboxypeptidase